MNTCILCPILFVGCRIELGMHEKHTLTLILPMIVVFLNKDILIAIEHLRTVKEG